METPFVFGRLALESDFTNRDQERQWLIQNFKSRINTILISPRRWGKSSLVQQAAIEAIKTDKALHVIFLDVYSIRTEEEFYQSLAIEVLKASAYKLEVLLDNAKRFMGRFLPNISFNADNQNEISLSLDWKEVKKNPTDILNMAENIALEKGWKFIICIDEFQNISTFDDPLAFQKKLRSNWQKHQHTAYCMYGSKRHIMIDVFTSPSMPFYKFGDIFFLEKIKRENWIPFIVRRFNDTKKTINENNAALITDLAECHPYYVQQLAQQCWFRTRDQCTDENIRQAHQGILDQLSLLFQSKTDELTNPQLNFLKALIQGVEKFSSKETLEVFKIGTSANVVRVKKTLQNKEIIDIHKGKISLLDPMYKHWLQNDFFKLINFENN